MEVLLDTSFILSCVKEKVDFLKAREFGSLVLFKEVVNELKDLVNKGKGRDKTAANLALEIIEKNKDFFDIRELGEDFVDKGLIEYSRTNKVIVATLDKELKNLLKGKSRILTLKGKGKIGLS